MVSECRELCDERKERNLERDLKELGGGMGGLFIQPRSGKTLPELKRPAYC